MNSVFGSHPVSLQIFPTEGIKDNGEDKIEGVEMHLFDNKDKKVLVLLYLGE